MKTVWIVLQEITWEGATLVGVYADQSSAEQEAARRNTPEEKSYGVTYKAVEYDVH